jgi:hypothetical protein
MLTEQVPVTLAVGYALDALGVPYAIGGSLVGALRDGRAPGGRFANGAHQTRRICLS